MNGLSPHNNVVFKQSLIFIEMRVALVKES